MSYPMEALMYSQRTWIEKIDPPLPAPEDIVAMGPGDVHLAAENRIKALTELVTATACQVFFIIGDFLDHTDLDLLCAPRGTRGRLRKRECAFIKLLEEKRKAGMRIVFILGNHDAELPKMLVLARLRLAEEGRVLSDDVRHILETLLLIENWEWHYSYYCYAHAGFRYLFNHGDMFDHIVHKYRALTDLSGVWWERIKRYDTEREWFSAKIKKLVKNGTKIAERVAVGSVELAHAHGADVAIAGHTHTAEVRLTEREGRAPLKYMNIGSFDLRLSNVFTVTRGGRCTLHSVSTWRKPRSRSNINGITWQD